MAVSDNSSNGSFHLDEINHQNIKGSYSRPEKLQNNYKTIVETNEKLMIADHVDRHKKLIHKSSVID